MVFELQLAPSQLSVPQLQAHAAKNMASSPPAHRVQHRAVVAFEHPSV